jgi:hypothetical protein
MTDETKSAAEATKQEKKNSLNLFDCPAGGPVVSERALEEVCPVCKEVEVEDEVGVGIGDAGRQEGGWRLWVGSRILIDGADC